MIITSVKLDPFGGLSGRVLQFRPGLNVIAGPNEAGKSTIFWAIQRAFFTPARLHKRDFEREIRRFLPVGGGDTVRVELRFRHNEQEYELRKTWGATPQAELRKADGSLITDEALLTRELGALLPAKEGTFKTVLMTYQSGLEKTLDDLRKHPETIHTLGDLLRRVVMETDGVSVDLFRERIQALYEEYFSRWDRDRHYPEGGRGPNAPWRRDVGKILAAFYEKEKIKKSLEDARRYEDELDRLNKQIAEVCGRLSEKEQYIEANKKAVEDARERRTLTAELKIVQASIEEMEKVKSEWPRLEGDIERIRGEVIPGLEEKKKKLLAEKARADAIEKNKAVIEKLRRVEEKKKALNEAGEKLEKVKRLASEDLDKILSAANMLARLRAGIDAGKLAVDFKAKKKLEIRTQKDFEEEDRNEIEAHGALSLEAGGRIRLEHADWLMEVTSGKGNFDQIKKRYDETREELAGLLEKHGVKTPKEAREVNRIYEGLVTRRDNARRNYDLELGKDSYEDLKERARAIGDSEVTRPIAEIATDIANTENKLRENSEEVEKKKEELQGFIERYESKEKLICKFDEEMGKKQEIKDKIKGLAPLPEDVEDVEKFIEEFEQAANELAKVRAQKNALEVQRAGLHEPEESTEELEGQLKDAEERFEAVRRKGEAIARIGETAGKILKDMDVGTYGELEKDLRRYVAAITDNRYSEVRLQSGLPSGFVRRDGTLLSYDLLSMGTKDMLGLALRLSMADHFLHDAEGFLIMDDPLVNLDPERQRRAAEIIRTYARKKQTIVFTCHPANAELLGGHAAELNT